jgi:hypothetical protein
MTPVEQRVEGIKKDPRFFGKTDDLKHNGNLLGKIKEFFHPFYHTDCLFY